jgi:arginyl-tRNA--protein-N-Asp/Glu arginylyltransferase
MSLELDRFASIFRSIPLAPESDCSYFDDLRSRARAFRLGNDVKPDFLESALDRGYRRCGDIYYQQDCPACALCVNYRIPIAGFKPTRSQRRVFSRNSDLQSTLLPPTPSPEKEDIYLRYQQSQHYTRPAPGAPIRHFDPDAALDTMYFQMYTNPNSSRELELRLDGRLVGFGILDVAIQSVSAVYFVFDPEYHKRSLGTLAILREIEWACAHDFRWFQLGFYIAGHAKMEYKSRFGPGEYLHQSNHTWEPDPPFKPKSIS